MKTLFILSLIIAIINETRCETWVLDYNCGRSSVNQRTPEKYIIGGEDATDGEFPFIAFLLINSEVSCGATIINEYWLLTAAHCVDDLMPNSNITITVGVVDIESPHRQTYKIKKVYVYKGWNSKNLNHDIALMRTEKLIETKPDIHGRVLIGSACLPAAASWPLDNEPLYIAGWGVWKPYSWSERLRDNVLSITNFPFMQERAFRKNLQKTEMSVRSSQYCDGLFEWQFMGLYPMPTLTDNVICVVNERATACYGDSGGPLVQNYKGKTYLLGITSWGREKCPIGAPNIYTRVAVYIEWIRSIVENRTILWND